MFWNCMCFASVCFAPRGFAARFRKICKKKTLQLLGIPPKLFLDLITARLVHRNDTACTLLPATAKCTSSSDKFDKSCGWVLTQDTWWNHDRHIESSPQMFPAILSDLECQHSWQSLPSSSTASPLHFLGTLHSFARSLGMPWALPQLEKARARLRMDVWMAG